MVPSQVRVVQHKRTKALYALKYINKQVNTVVHYHTPVPSLLCGHRLHLPPPDDAASLSRGLSWPVETAIDAEPAWRA